MPAARWPIGSIAAHLSPMPFSAVLARVNHLGGEHLCRRVRVSQRPKRKTHRFRVRTEIHESWLWQQFYGVLASARTCISRSSGSHTDKTPEPTYAEEFHRLNSPIKHQYRHTPRGFIALTALRHAVSCDDNGQKSASNASDFIECRAISYLC